MMGHSTLADLARLRSAKSRRISSYDRTGGNRDWYTIAPGEAKPIAEIAGAGCIRHIWCTMWSKTEYYLRKVLIRMYWDGESEPSVDCPIGDFFGVPFGTLKEFWSLPLAASPKEGRGFNCYFAMPFADGARVEIINEGEEPVNFYFYIDYEEYPSLEPGLGRFHAQWRRENPTRGYGDDKSLTELWKVPNLDGQAGDGNYVILEARGRGHYVGCNLQIDQFEDQKNKWYGEGDDMIFIDDEPLPRLYGTGTEDYFNTAFGPNTEFCTPYYGITLNSGDPDNPWRGKNALYRFHIEDPIHFEKSIRVTIEHGHANKLTLDYASTAYWYQTEPHAPFPPMLPVAERLPRVYTKRVVLDPAGNT